MKRITAFAFGLSIIFLLQTSCIQKLPEDAIYSADLKYAFYLQSFDDIKKEYNKLDPTLKTRIFDDLLDLTDRAIIDGGKCYGNPDCPPIEIEDDCCAPIPEGETCHEERCKTKMPPSGTIFMIFTEPDPHVNIYDEAGKVIGTIDPEKRKKIRGFYVFPIILTVDTLPERYDIELVEKEETYKTRYILKR